ncbi:uracil-DNA glycosylase [Pendulispora brunnea]|uniref:Type-5 uracil-DNA glycosylase n=1 Tax=Pendulispora brunnea TaxID=2905690 RepID=A0ABZ2KPV6_9BACT
MSTPFYPDLPHLHEEIVTCRACPRLVDWREKVAREKRRMFASWTYWGKPVPGFGDPAARIVFVGLAPAAHGANRTGRMFTGDRSGDFLFAALHRAGLANQPTSTSRDDGLALNDVFIVAPVRCAPPDNQPLPEEITACQPFLDRELALLPNARVLIALGGIAWDAVLRHFERRDLSVPRPRPKFGHGARAAIEGAPLLLGSFHVSQQNTQTGRLTPAMFDQVLAVAKRTVGFRPSSMKNSKP